MILDKCFLEVIKNKDNIHYQIHKKDTMQEVEYDGN